MLVVLAAAAIALTLVGGTAQGCLGGLQRYSFLNLTVHVAVIVQATAFAVVLWLGGQLVALGIVLVSVVLVEQVARFLALRSLRSGGDAVATKRRPRVRVGDLRVSAWISSTQVATAVRYRMDTIVVGFVVRCARSWCLRRRPVPVHRRRPLHPAEPDRVLPVLRGAGRAA